MLLLISNDGAAEYRFKHDVRLLRPMGLDISRLSEELAVYFPRRPRRTGRSFSLAIGYAGQVTFLNYERQVKSQADTEKQRRCSG